MTVAFEEKFCAEKFVRNLFENGSAILCDLPEKCDLDEVPDFYSKEKFERGRNFIYKYFFSVLISKIIALIVGLADPFFNEALQKTGKSSIAKSSYKRYISTIKHILLWYTEDFQPGSKSWKSLKTVKAIHAKSSKFISEKGLPKINQRDMAVTQLGFILVILIPKRLGIFGASKEDLAGFVHIWRNVGKVLGIQDEFNICRDSLEETIQICNALFHSLFPIYIQKMTENDYNKMATVFIDAFKGLLSRHWMGVAKYLLMQYRYPNYSLDEMEYDDRNKKEIRHTLSFLKLFRFSFIRICSNGIARLVLWVLFHL